MKYIQTFESYYNESFNLNGLLTNIKYKMVNPGLIKDFIDVDKNMVYIKIPLNQIKTVNDADSIVSIANKYKDVQNAYVDGNSSSIMIQAHSDEPIIF